MSVVFFYWVDIRNRIDRKLVGPLGDLPNNGFISQCCGRYALGVKARNLLSAHKKLDTWIQQQSKELDIQIVPIPVDYQFLRKMFLDLRTLAKVGHLLPMPLPLKKIKTELNRAIQKNNQWSSRLTTLLDTVCLYENKRSSDLEAKIRSGMYELGVRPDGIIT